MSVKRITIFIVTLLLFVITAGYAQNINTQDLSSINVDELSDSQIMGFLQQAESSGLSESQLMQMAKARGMSTEQLEKLQDRISKLEAKNGTSNATEMGLQNRKSVRKINGDTDSLADPLKKIDTLPKQDSLRSRIYGADLFFNAHPVFEPNLTIATPLDYIIGAGDEINIDIYGQSEASYSLQVSPDGNINIPYAGVVNVGGASIQQATKRIKEKLTVVYKALATGGTKVAITLGNIRSIKVVLTGEVVQPGTYTLPSVASVFNALYSAGGPTSTGSLRNITVVRGGEVIAHLDLYDFLQTGSMKANINLRDQDVIQVSPYLSRVELIGAVKRPMLFEIKPGETFDDLLRYAGGFTEDAYTDRISVVRKTGKEYQLEDLLKSQFAQFEPHAGDQFTIEKILDRFTNRITLRGAVFRPGNYELSPGLTLSMLIKKADGLKEDAFVKRAYLIRLKDDFQREQLSFSPAEILAGTQADITLKREDVVVIPSLFDLREEYTVTLNGEVRHPGQYPFSEGMTLQSLILEAGGFTEGASVQRVEVARRVHNTEEDLTNTSAHTADIFNISVNRNLTLSDTTFELQPFDLVNVRPSAGYEYQRTVRIEGEVRYPGDYTLVRKDERVSDLIERAGGFTPYAYVAGASLKRRTVPLPLYDRTSNNLRQEQATKAALEQERIGRLQSLQSATNNPAGSHLEQNMQNNYVGINLEQIIANPGRDNDLLLEGGDVLRVPKQLQTVKVSGEVLSPVTSLYADNKSFKAYISEAGGFSQQALRKRSFVVYANGSARSTKKILFFNNYPKIKPGSEIFVPQRLPRERLNATQILGLGTGLASLAAIVVSLLK
ncbi:SLBB domain-containing protein [Olivibacter ginsenosidimutans]